MRPKFLRLLAEILHQLIAIDALRKARKILHFRSRGELAAGQNALNDEGLEISTASINGRGETGTAGTDDHDIFNCLGHIIEGSN